jgi:hypothetical protein
MALDPDAQSVTINYPGGSLRMALGNAKSLFGENNPNLSPDGIQKTVSVKSHTRTRVIGEASTPVEATTYTYTQWPVGEGGNAAGGEAILLRWDGSEGWWTARMSGSAWELGSFLNTSVPNAVEFKTENGTHYGPFIIKTL